MGKHEPPGRIHGRVVRASNGQPIARASVRVWDDISAIDLQRSNSRGKFTSRLLFAGTYKVEAQCEDGVGSVDGVEVKLGETTEVTVVIR